MAKRMKRTTKLTVESEHLMIIRRRRAPSREWCPTCGDIVNAVTAEEAAALLRVSPLAVYGMLNAEKLHFIEANEILLLVCSNSVSCVQPSANCKGENDEP